jgi:hypothetical protein
VGGDKRFDRSSRALACRLFEARAEGAKMSEPPVRPKEFNFSSRTIVLIILGMIATAALTIEGTYSILNTFVLHDPSDPLAKAGGLSPKQPGKAKGE